MSNMPPVVFLTVYTLGIWVGAFLLHLIWWRVSLPANQRRALIVVFAIVLLIGAVVLLLMQSWLEALWFLIVTGPLSLTYIAFYSAIEADSPSLSMVLRTACHGKAGCEETDYSDIISEETLLKHRLGEMEADGLARREGDSLVASAKGLKLARLFHLLGELLGLAKGG